jgi:bis(5'-nucleosidyl)-tetraphosphatase
VKQVISSGGLLYRVKNNTLYWLLVKHQKAGHWSFPKGHVGDNIEKESNQEAALREVFEEGGCKGKIIYHEPFTNSYNLYEDAEFVRKTVLYFLMEYLSGSPELHDHEISEAGFFTYEDALNLLTFETDKNILKEGNAFVLNTRK